MTDREEGAVSDIVERLRTTWSVSVEHSTNPWLSELNVEDSASDVALEAADEIERLRAEVEGLRSDVQFLLNRLAEIDIPEEIAREWMGHVEPAMERVRAALAAREQGDGWFRGTGAGLDCQYCAVARR